MREFRRDKDGNLYVVENGEIVDEVLTFGEGIEIRQPDEKKKGGGKSARSNKR